MYWELYLALMALAGACTLIVLVVRKSIIPLGMAASGLWSILALQAQNIVIYHQDGTSTVVGSEPWQYVALGLALLNIGVVILYWWEAFPPKDGEIIEKETV
jgi:hypothetical protein